MLSIEIKVNGRPVAVIEAYNNGFGFLGEDNVDNYPYRGFRFPLNRDDGAEVFRGTVEAHKYSDGILELSRRILECICEET